jgi:hypothetical protein
MTAIDGALTTFSYSGGLLSTILTVNSPTTTLSSSGTNLTQVTNPGRPARPAGLGGHAVRL